jgi:CRP-like cAMP-binding protein
MGVHEGRPADSRWPDETLLGRLSEPARASLVRLGARKAFPPGEVILRQGESESTVYLLLSGYVKVVGNEAGREPLLAIRVGGDLVGEMAALSGRPRSATVTACTATSARAIAGTDLRPFLSECPEVAIEVARMISERLQWANERRIDFAALPPRTRVSRVLLTLADTYGRDTCEGRDLGVRLIQGEVASLAGVKLTTAEKALRGLQRRGVVRLGYRKIVVADMPGLRAAAGRAPD